MLMEWQFQERKGKWPHHLFLFASEESLSRYTFGDFSHISFALIIFMSKTSLRTQE
jgi:hypothetical protein